MQPAMCGGGHCYHANVHRSTGWSQAMDRSLSQRALRNQLLRALPQDSIASLLEDFALRQFRQRDPVIERDQPIVEVVFPLTAVLSTVAQGAEQQIVEVATVGHEGMAGLAVFLNAERSGSLETFAQVPGDALCMRTRDFRKHIDRDAHLRRVLGLYTQALLSQISQGAACNRMHPAEDVVRAGC